MLFNYLKIALRTMLRYKSFSVINILGLTLGLTAFLCISLYVTDELSYDTFHANKDRIYRGVSTFGSGVESRKMGSTPNKLATTAAKEIPEVEKAARYFHHNFGDIAFITHDTDKFSEKSLYYADPELFDIFSFSFVKGNQAQLNKPGTVVISEAAAKKYFTDSDPVGQVLTVNGSLQLEVTGVYKNLPSNSFLKPDLIASFASNWFGQEQNQSWSNASFDSFFLLHEGVSQTAAEQKITAMFERNVEPERRRSVITLQPLLDIRLHSGDFNATSDRREYGDLKQVKILIALASIILIIAAVNYMNLSTAQSQRRNKEVGITKTLGATFFQLTRRFYTEALVFVLASMLLSFVAFSFMLPWFNALSGKNITMNFITSGWFWIGFAGIWFGLTLLSGLYPALYLSSFSPKSALQKITPSGGQAFVRKGLVVFQFSVSIILIICSVVFYKQMMFIRDKKLGYEPEQVLAVMTAPAKDRDQVLAVKTAYEGLSDVITVARSQSYPGSHASGRAIYKPRDEEGSPLQTMRATHETLSALSINLIAGHGLPETKDPTDTTVQLVVNRATVQYLGLTPEEAIGQHVSVMGFQATEIVGVTEDFHFNSLHQAIMPFCFHNGNFTEPYNYLLVKVNTGNLSATLKQLENIYQKNISASFEYAFLDERLSQLYRSEQNLSKVVVLFAGLAIFVACLGLYALATFTAEQRTKEIGIRKVLGASVSHVVGMLSRDFLILVVIAFVIGIPVGYYMMDKWLQGFAYKTDITLIVFVAAGLISMLIAGVTVSFESFRAASSNPVKSLRSE